MAKNSKSPKKEEEYHFAEGEEEFTEPEKPKRAGLKAILRNKRLWLIIGIILAVLVVYQFIGKKPPVKQEITELETKAMPTAVTPAAVQAPVSIPVVETTPSATADQLNAVAKQAQQNQLQIQQLQAGLLQLQTNVSQLSSQVSSLTNTVNSLAQTMTKPVAQPTVVVPAKKVIPQPFYSVRAVVPGRAWIQQKKNQHVIRTFTVKVGDFIPGYGRVQAIDSRAGRVMMSWGSVIKYENGFPLASP